MGSSSTSEGVKGLASVEQPQDRVLKKEEDTRRARTTTTMYEHLPKHAAQDVRSSNQPWPMPVAPEELDYWLDVLGDYTETAGNPVEGYVRR